MYNPNERPKVYYNVKIYLPNRRIIKFNTEFYNEDRIIQRLKKQGKKIKKIVRKETK